RVHRKRSAVMPGVMSRRAFLGMAALAGFPRGALAAPFQRETPDFARPDLEREQDGPLLRTRVVNRGRAPIQLHDVTVFEQPISLLPETELYGEGFQMLTQTGGTLASPSDLSQYTDAAHYRIPATVARAYYGLLTLTPPAGVTQVFAFTSCARFSGRFEIAGSAVRALVDCEGLSLPPGASWPLEELMV